MSLFQKIRKSTHYSMHPDCIAIDDDGNPAIPLRHTTFLLKGRPFIKAAPSFAIYVSCYLLYLSTIFWVDF